MKSHQLFMFVSAIAAAYSKAAEYPNNNLCQGAVNCEVVDGKMQFKDGMGPDSDWYQVNVADALNNTETADGRRQEQISSTIWGAPSAINYGNVNPGDIIHQLFEACGEHGCVSQYSIPEDTHFVIGASAGYSGTQQVSAQIALEIEAVYSGYDQRNALIEALTGTARQGFESKDKPWELTQYIANPMGGTWTVISEGSQTEHTQSSEYQVQRRRGSAGDSSLIDYLTVRVKVTMGDYNTFPCEQIKTAITAAIGFFVPVVADMLGSVVPACL
ncbi:hypothetical protein ACHAQA_004040 [Verticillium albo-atrum]